LESRLLTVFCDRFNLPITQPCFIMMFNERE
jgi:hypothetical protein